MKINIYVAATTGLVAAGSAVPAQADTVIITYTSAVAAVPLSPWTLVAIAIALGLLAITVMKSRGQARLFGAGFALILGGFAIFASEPVQARIRSDISLPASGQSVSTGQTGSYTISVTNRTGRTVTITDVVLTPSAAFDRRLDRSDRCVAGPLASNANCTLSTMPGS